MTTSRANTASHCNFQHFRAHIHIVLTVLVVTLLGGASQTAHAATIHVSSGGDFQAALNSAQPGDTIELAAGATFTGPFTLPHKTGTGTDADWITIRTSAPDSSLPAAGQRITPSYASVLPKLVSPGLGQAVLYTQPRAHHYRFVGVEFAPSNSDAFIYSLIVLGGSGAEQDTLEEVPHHLVIDRCYVHAFPTQGLKRGIELNSAHTDVLNSYVAGFKTVGQEAQAIQGWNGPGPFRIINNYLEGAGENVMFGGGAIASIPNLVPSDIEVKRNHFYKPLSWRVGDPSYAGQEWSIKNLFELKNARRVVIDGNVFENSWRHAQVGDAILFTVRGEDGAMPWATVEDVEFTNNVVRHAASGVQIMGRDNRGASQQTRRVTIRNNVFEDIDGARWCDPTCSSGQFLSILNATDAVTADHNTIFQTGNVISAEGPAHTNFVFTNNVARHNDYGVHGTDRLPGPDSLNFFFPGYVFRRNLIAGAPPHVYPSDNYYPPASEFDAQFVNRAGGDYRLAPTSCGSTASGCSPKGGTDGADVGANIDAVNAATAGAVSGTWGAQQSPYAGTPAPLPGNVEAENFDNGGEGVAYHDSGAGNNGGEYRSTDVDIRSMSTASSGFVVFNAVAGEWLEYSVNVNAAGYYEIGAYSASRLAGGTFHIEVDGVNVTGSLTAPTTGSWWVFQPASRGGVYVAAGTHVVRLALDTNGVEGIVADFDRLFFNPSAPEQTPFNGAPFAVPGTITAEDFDNGGEGVAYHDLTPGNTSGSTYRNTDVDMWDRTVLSIQTGEWLEYTINVSATRSTYGIVLQLSSDSPGGTVHVELDGANVTGPLSIPHTSSWSYWRSAIKTGATLTAGQHVLRVFFDNVTGFGGLQSIRIVDTSQALTPFSGTAISLPGVVQTSDFDNGGELVSYHDNTAGCWGSCWYRTSDVDMWDRTVARASAGEWMKYSVNVAATGTYTLTAEVASDTGGGTFHVEFDGVDVTGPLTIPYTGGWNTFQTVTKTGVSLTAGPKVMRIVVDSNSPGGGEAGSFNTVRIH